MGTWLLKNEVLLRDFPSGHNNPGSTITPDPRALVAVHRPEEKENIEIPSHWPSRINYFLNGHRGGISFFCDIISGCGLPRVPRHPNRCQVAS